jgi:antirestriction protein
MTYQDTRDLEEELQGLLQLKEDNEEYDQDRLKELEDLKEELEGYGWEYGIALIPEVDFEDYARELAEDCFMGSDAKTNPLMNHIDWESWANDVEMDYSSVEFEGTTYLWREA